MSNVALLLMLLHCYLKHLHRYYDSDENPLVLVRAPDARLV